MKALNFLEWVLLEPIESSIDYLNIWKVANFYNQKFSTDMLVNPYIKLIFDKSDYYAKGKINPNWQQAESIRLFEVKYIPEGHYEINGSLFNNGIWEEIQENGCVTVDYFIQTLRHRYNCDIHWNPNNQTVKELGL